MKKRQIFILTAALAGAAVMGVGCGKKMTAEDLIAEVSKNTEDKKSVEANLKMDFAGKISMKQSGVTAGVDMAMGVDMDLEALMDKENPENASTYMKGTMDMEVLGANMSIEMENYTIVEDGKAVTYTGAQDMWTREEQDLDEGVQNEMLGMDLESLVKDGTKVELADQTEKIGDKECYKLTIGVSGDVLNEMMDMSSGLMAGAAVDTDEFNFSDSTLDYVMYVDKSEKLPVKITVDAKSMMDSIMKALEESGASAEIEKFDVVVEVKDYDTVDEIKVPDDVKEQAVDASGGGLLDDGLGGAMGTDDGLGDVTGAADETWETDANGNPVITNYDGDLSVSIVLPEGFEIGYADGSFLGVNSGDASASYMFNDYTTDEDMVNDTMDSLIEEYPDEYLNYQKSEVMEFELNGQKVRWFKENYSYVDNPCVDATAWIALDEDTMFVCEIDKFGVAEGGDITQEDIAAMFGGVTLQQHL